MRTKLTVESHSAPSTSSLFIYGIRLTTHFGEPGAAVNKTHQRATSCNLIVFWMVRISKRLFLKSGSVIVETDGKMEHSCTLLYLLIVTLASLILKKTVSVFRALFWAHLND